MEATSTIDLRPATSSEMGAYDRHVEHDPAENHDNKMIVQSDRDLNNYHVINDENSALKDQYGNYLAERNAKLEIDFKSNKISSEQYTSRKQSVQEYVHGSNGSKEKKIYTSAVLTVADGDTQRNMLDKLGWDYDMIGVGEQNKNGEFEHYRPQLKDVKQRETWSRLWDSTYTQTAKDISNDSLRVISVATNLDEGGGAHAHVKFLNMGHTDKGKPSTTMNGALKEMFLNKNSRENLRQFRATYDPLMIANFNKSAEALGLDLHLDMIRTREAGAADMPTYKAQKKHETALKEQTEQIRKDAKVNNDNANKNMRLRMLLLKQSEQIKKREAELKQKAYDLQTKDDITQVQLTSLHSREKQVTERENSVMIQQKKQQKLIKMQQREQVEAKNSIAGVIKQYDPQHKVRMLGDNAVPINTDVGMQQHMAQSLGYLVRVAKRTIANVAKKLVDMNYKVKHNLDLAQIKQDLKKPENGGKNQKDDGLDL